MNEKPALDLDQLDEAITKPAPGFLRRPPPLHGPGEQSSADSVRDYASDRVYDGVRPISDARADQLRAAVVAYAPRRIRDAQGGGGPDEVATPVVVVPTEPARASAPPAAPHPLSDAARELVSKPEIARAELFRDRMNGLMDERVAQVRAAKEEHQREDDLRIEEAVAQQARWKKMGDDHVAKVTAECEARARAHANDRSFFAGADKLAAEHGFTLPAVEGNR